MIGIKEELLSFPEGHFEQLTEPCQKDCPFIAKAPHCQFMDAYYRYLSTLDFKYILSLFEETAEEVRKATHFKGEPIIVLLVYEAASKVCGERYGLRRWFEDNGYELPEWQKQDMENIF